MCSQDTMMLKLFALSLFLGSIQATSPVLHLVLPDEGVIDEGHDVLFQCLKAPDGPNGNFTWRFNVSCLFSSVFNLGSFDVA